MTKGDVEVSARRGAAAPRWGSNPRRRARRQPVDSRLRGLGPTRDIELGDRGDELPMVVPSTSAGQSGLPVRGRKAQAACSSIGMTCQPVSRLRSMRHGRS